MALEPGEFGDYGIGYYDRQGTRIHLTKWALLRERGQEYITVATTNIESFWISTVWLGMDHRFRMPGEEDAPPLIFETMVFNRDDGGVPDMGADPDDALDLHPEVRGWVGVQCRYSTEAEAIAGHDAICLEIRLDLARIQEAEQVKEEMREWVRKVRNEKPE